MKRKLFLYGSVFGLVVLFDLVKYLSVGEPNIINWQSFWHPAWVILALAVLLANALFFNKSSFYFSFLIYFLVTIAALLNQYVPYWEVLTYNCFLFNMVFASMYYLLTEKRV